VTTPSAERRRTSGRVRPPVDETSFTRNLRSELAGEEGQALIGSSSISIALGVLWILLVIFGPRTEASHLLSAEERPIAVTFEAPPEEPAKAEPTPAAPKVAAAPSPKPSAKPSGPSREETQAAAIAGAFGAAPAPNGPVGDVSNVLRGVAVAANASTPTGAATGGKTVLAYGQGGQGSRTPGRDDLGGGAAGTGSIGGVQGGGGFGAQAVRISAPKVIDAPSLGGPTRDIGELGTQVRDHQSQLRFCYDEFGLKVNPSLAGSVTMAITLTGGGAVTKAEITSHTWNGAGVEAVESCILQRAHGWRFPASAAGGGTYEFSFNFTK
jgi:hypothetical protein